MADLLDVNVWVALSVPRHTHHAAAIQYLRADSSEELNSCRHTELAVLRLLSNERAFGDDALSGASAWAALQTMLGDRRVTSLAEPPAIDDVLSAWASEVNVRGGHWSDAYLAAFAVAAECRLVSFDGDFARYPGLSWLHLEP